MISAESSKTADEHHFAGVSMIELVGDARKLEQGAQGFPSSASVSAAVEGLADAGGDGSDMGV